MNTWRIWALVLAAAAWNGCGPGSEATRTAKVTRGDLVMRVPFQGELEARQVARIAVEVQGSAVLSELVEEGAHVEQGDVIARFDATQIEQDLARQENELVRTRQELASLEEAELPMELMELESKRADAQAEEEAETRFLESVRSLAERGLMSEGEVERQEAKAAEARVRVEQVEKRMELTRDHVHVARLAKARAALEAAESQRDFTARQRELCVVRAPVSGVATRVPLPVGGDYRTAHVGDTLYHNQVFLCLPDSGEHVVRGFIGEAELPWIQAGRAVEAVPPAYPDLRLTGRVEQVGGMAQTRPGQPVWRKFFPVQLALDPLPAPLPVGITVQAEILAGEARNVLLVPREAVEWRGDHAFVKRAGSHGRAEDVPIETGLASATQVEIRSGLAESEQVLIP